MPVRIRRDSPEPRIEMAPLLDVVFLLLTFFIFAVVLMERAPRLLGIDLPALGRAEADTPPDIVLIAIDGEGRVRVGETVVYEMTTANATEDEVARREQLASVLGPALDGAVGGREGVRFVIAADTGSRSGVLLAVIDTLQASGITDFSLAGRTDAAPARDTPATGSPERDNGG